MIMHFIKCNFIRQMEQRSDFIHFIFEMARPEMEPDQ